MAKELDLVIVGAGAAGIGAGLQARAAGLDFALLEAADRVGGRAHTIHLPGHLPGHLPSHLPGHPSDKPYDPGHPYDLGCHYLHSASRNVFATRALARGLTLDMTLNAEETPGAYYRDGVLQDEAARIDCRDSYDRFFTAIDEAEGAEGDVAAASLTDRDGPHYDAITAWCAAINGVPPERYSTADSHGYHRAPEDWPVKEGYGALIASFAEGLPVYLNCPAEAIDRSGTRVQVETPDGTLSAKAVIVTLSTAALRSGAIRFTPDLPASLQTALEQVPMGYAERVALVADGPFVDEAVYAHVVPKAGPGIGLMFQEFDLPIIGAYIAGDIALDLARDGGRDALIAYAEEASCEILGSDIRRRLVHRRSSCWSTDPLIQGGYAAALPGCYAARSVLRERFDDRVRLAGEACSPHAFTTAHGAYESGVSAVSALFNDRIL